MAVRVKDFFERVREVFYPPRLALGVQDRLQALRATRRVGRTQLPVGGLMDASAWIAALSALVAVVAVVFAAMQARHAHTQADASRRQTELQEMTHRDAAQPYVWVDFRPDDRNGFILDLVVKNEGPTVATDVVITFDPPLTSSLSADFGARLTLASLPPARTLRWHFESATTLFGNDDAQRRYLVNVEAIGPFGPTPTLTYPLDLNDYFKTAIAPAGTLHDITKEIKKVAAEVRKSASSLRSSSQQR